MEREVMHIEASRSWWNGSAKTLCGITIPNPHTYWFPSVSSATRCQACEAAHRSR